MKAGDKVTICLTIEPVAAQLVGKTGVVVRMSDFWCCNKSVASVRIDGKEYALCQSVLALAR